MKEEKRKDELRQIAPELSGMKREDGFTTPHNYFSELPDRVMARIAKEQKKPEPQWGWLWNLMKPRYAMALASVLILIVAGIWYSRMQTPADPFATITEDEVLDYVLDNLHDFSSDDLISAGVFTEWDATEILPVSEDVLDEILEDGELMEELF